LEFTMQFSTSVSRLSINAGHFVAIAQFMHNISVIILNLFLTPAHWNDTIDFGLVWAADAFGEGSVCRCFFPSTQKYNKEVR